MVYINEWLPNPVGTDAKGEFIELYNDGNAPVDLKGWALTTEGHKKFSLTGSGIPAHGYLLLDKARTKLSLKNSNGGLALYNSRGERVDEGSFTGSAPEGQSFSRIDHSNADTQQFAFVAPTPGAANRTINNEVAVYNYPPNATLTPRVTGIELFAMAVGTGAILAGLILYIIRSHEDLSHLFFGRDESAGASARKRALEKS